MKRSKKKAFLVIVGLMLMYIPIKLLGDVVQRSDLSTWIAYPIHFLLGSLSIVIIWMAVKILD
jgi:hypothetical protein